MKHLTKRQYNLAFIELTRSLVNESISFDTYKILLHELMENYRKDKKYGFA